MATAPPWLIGKCKKCKRGFRVTETGRTEDRANHRYELTFAGGLTGVQRTGEAGTAFLRCPCGAWAKVETLRGRWSPVHICSRRCMNATGTECDCSCAGKNHGGSYVYTEAGAPPPAKAKKAPSPAKVRADAEKKRLSEIEAAAKREQERLDREEDARFQVWLDATAGRGDRDRYSTGNRFNQLARLGGYQAAHDRYEREMGAARSRSDAAPPRSVRGQRSLF